MREKDGRHAPCADLFAQYEVVDNDAGREWRGRDGEYRLAMTAFNRLPGLGILGGHYPLAMWALKSQGFNPQDAAGSLFALEVTAYYLSSCGSFPVPKAGLVPAVRPGRQVRRFQYRRSSRKSTHCSSRSR